MVDSKHQYKAWIYLAPALILLLIFTVWPIFNTLRMAFSNGYNSMTAVKEGEFSFSIGVDNFVKVVQYKGFTNALLITLLLTVITVPVSTLLALLIAVCLNSIKPLNRLLQTIYFLPYVTNSIAIGMVFAAMFNVIGRFDQPNMVKTYGIVNQLLNVFGISPVNWINTGSNIVANMSVMVIYIIWNALPFKILILLGGLQSVNKQYYEAAKIDGTSRARTFWRITVPLLSPMIAYVVITGFIGGFKEYTSIVGIFGETMGPPDKPKALMTMVGYIYDQLPGGKYGLASAAALILFVIILIITIINLQVSKKRTHY